MKAAADIIQLRDKNSVGRRELGKMTIIEQLEALRVLAEVVHAHGALLTVNDRMDWQWQPAPMLPTSDKTTFHRGSPTDSR
ncbi:MAG: hypothetical protein U1U88_000951 [Lawsonella clevelandensis]